jgi:hypothetical protein
MNPSRGHVVLAAAVTALWSVWCTRERNDAMIDLGRVGSGLPSPIKLPARQIRWAGPLLEPNHMYRCQLYHPLKIHSSFNKKSLRFQLVMKLFLIKTNNFSKYP